jgi:hypothetical protein
MIRMMSISIVNALWGRGGEGLIHAQTDPELSVFLAEDSDITPIRVMSTDMLVRMKESRALNKLNPMYPIYPRTSHS